MREKAVIYVRVSTEHQGEGYSLESQEEKCRALAVARNYQVVAVFQDIESGEAHDRPGLDQLFGSVVHESIQHVIVFSIDRLTRSGPAFHAMIVARLAQTGAKLEFVQGGYGSDSPDSVLSAQILSSIAWYDNQVRKERFMRCKVQAAQNGRVLVSARPPYGYAVSNGRLVIDPEEAAVVERVFDWAAKGVSANEISRRLTAENVPTRADKDNAMSKKYGFGVWAKSTVLKMLHQQTYTGIWHYRKTRTIRVTGKLRLRKRPAAEQVPITVPSIVAKEIFDAVQEKLAARRSTNKIVGGPDGLLRGRLYCTCGRLCVATNKKNSKAIYRCQTRKNHPSTGTCENQTYERIALIDEAVWQAVVVLLFDPMALHSTIDNWRETHEQDLQRERVLLATAKNELRKVEKRLGALLDQLLTNAAISPESIKEREMLSMSHGQLQAEIEAKQALLEKNASLAAQKVSFMAFTKQLRQKMAFMDLEAKKKVMAFLNVRVTMLAKHKARVEALIPLPDDTVTWGDYIDANKGDKLPKEPATKDKTNESGIVTTSAMCHDHNFTSVSQSKCISVSLKFEPNQGVSGTLVVNWPKGRRTYQYKNSSSVV